MSNFFSIGSQGAASTLAAIGKSAALIEFDPSGKIKWANELFCNAMGYRLDEVKGRHHSMFVEPSYAASKDYRAFWEQLGRGEPEAHEFRRLAKGGREVWIQASYNPVVSRLGRVTKIVKVATDITEAKQEAMRDAGKIAAINRAQAVIEFTPDGIITSANDNFLSAVGYNLDEITGKHHRIFLQAAYAESADYAEFWRRLGSGEFIAGEFERVGKSGQSIWIQASYNPIFDSEGTVISVVKFATDVTDRVEAVEALADGLGQLADGNLRTELVKPFPMALEKLRKDYNKTVTSLSSIMAALTEISSSVDAGAQEISVASQDLSSRTEKNAASLEETAAALQDITSNVQESASGAKDASTSVSTAKVAAENGGAVVSQAIQAMSEIEGSSQEIREIITVIDEIAFQTNLLALNAGVEAARAGDAGQGFAVVATEVRGLAQRSADAAKRIAELIATSTSQVDQGVKLVAETGQALDEIVNNIGAINSVISEIAEGAQNQSASIQQINNSVLQMDQDTQQNAAMSEQATAASRSLAEKVRELAILIARFQFRDDRSSPTFARSNSEIHQGLH